LPLLGFYLVAPLLVLGLHLNLLINLLQHSRKLNRWLDGETTDKAPQDRLHPFIFNVYRASRPKEIGYWLSGLLVALLAYFLPMPSWSFTTGKPCATRNTLSASTARGITCGATTSRLFGGRGDWRSAWEGWRACTGCEMDGPALSSLASACRESPARHRQQPALLARAGICRAVFLRYGKGLR